MDLSALIVTAALLGGPTQQLPAVRGQGEELASGASSTGEVDTQRPADLAIDPVRALSGVPGVVIADRRNEAQDPKLVVRGFGARSAFGIRGIRLEVDGIPATMPDGQGQLSHVPWSADAVVSIERGPLAVLAGASGALLRVQTLPELAPTAQAETVIAGGDRQRASAEIASVDDERSRYGGVSLLGYRNGGFRPHSRAERTQLGARWQQPGLGGSWQLVAHALHSRADDPLGLSRAEFLRDPDGTVSIASSFDTRKSLDHVELGWHWRSLNGRTSISSYVGNRQIEQFLAIPAVAQRAPTSAGAVIDLQRDFGGLSFTSGDDPLTDPSGWRYGLGIEQQRERRRGFENFIDNRLGVRGNLRRDERNRATASHALVEGWWGNDRHQLRGGARLAQLRMRSDDDFIASGNPDDSGSAVDLSISPALVYRWQAGESLQFDAGLGFGLEVPTLAERAYSADGGGFNADLEASRFRHLDLGMRWRLNPRWQLATNVYRIDSRDELVVAESSGGRSVFGNASSGGRSGLELLLVADLPRDWQARLSANWIHARINDDDGNGSVALPGQPARWGQLSLLGPLSERDRLGLDWQLSSAIPVDTSTSERAPGYGRVDAWWTRQIGQRGPVISVRIDNLFDRRYAGSVIVGDRNGRYYEPAAGRELGLGLRWEWR